MVSIFYNESARSNEKKAAFDAYQKALVVLRQRPTNPTARQNALNLGREYSNLTRDKKGVTVYDEVALMNDIGAATAGAVSAQPPQQRTLQKSPSIESRLAKLEELSSRNLISEEEYLKKRNSILDEI